LAEHGRTWQIVQVAEAFGGYYSA
jgi:hypothetical protein